MNIAHLTEDDKLHIMRVESLWYTYEYFVYKCIGVYYLIVKRFVIQIAFGQIT